MLNSISPTARFERQRKILFSIILCSFAIIATTLIVPEKCFAAINLEKVTLQLKWFHQFQFAGYYTALEKGYYEDEGLDVSIIERDLRQNPIDLVLEGTADFGVSNSEILLEYLQGKEVVLLASIFQHSPLIFISKTQPLIHSVQGLKGKTVLMNTTSQEIELKVMLDIHNVSLDDIKLIDRFAVPEDYFDPTIDVIAAYTTNQPYYFKKENVPYSIIYPYTHGVDFYGDTLFTSRHQIQEHPDRVNKFLRASLKGWQYALAHPDEIIEVIMDKFGSLKSREHLKYEAETIQNLILPDLVRIGYSNPVRWQRIGEEFKKQGLVKQTKDLTDFFYNPTEGKVTIKQETAFIAAAIFGSAMLVLLASIYVAGKLKHEIKTRLEIEKKLKESEKYYRSIFENTGTAIIIYTLENCIIKKCNEQYAELCGVPREEIENKRKVSEFIADEDSKRLRGYTKDNFLNKNSAPKSFDFKFVRANGEIRNVHANTEIINGSTNCIGSLIDMTEKVKTQELLIQTEKMISVGSLAAEMAHEINNPLAGILQAVQNIHRRISADSPASVTAAEKHGCTCEQISAFLEDRDVLRMLGTIQSAGERAANIVWTMLNFARRNDEGQSSCDLNQIFDDITNIITRDYHLNTKHYFKHTKIIKEYQENIDKISCQRIEIEQVLLNLIKNAAYATNQIAEYRQPIITLRTRTDDKFIIAEVEDNGPGMTSEVKRRVFEPFFTTKSPGIGTGLGLSVSYFIITQNHGGLFEIDTEIGKGSKFTIKIPRA